MDEKWSQDDRSGTNDGKGAPSVSRRALLLGLFVLPIAAILEPEPALAQFGALLAPFSGGVAITGAPTIITPTTVVEAA